MKDTPLIFELSRPGRTACSLPECDVPQVELDTLIPAELRRSAAPELPEVDELTAVRHFTNLSQLNHGLDAGFYPLGSCTMKYNPKRNEAVARLNGFAKLHPYQPDESTQGALRLLYELGTMLAEITGMQQVSLQPAAGSQGELAGLMIIQAYHHHNGDAVRDTIVIPDSAHGTNPASAAVAGFKTVEVKSDAHGGVDLDALRKLMGPHIAGLMLTNPNTLGIFDPNIIEIAKIVHEAGGLLYYDGANANAILGITRPGDMGFDVVHLNLHKTFSTPHGGGGPGAGPIGVCEKLVPFLPKPVVVEKDGVYGWDYDRPLSIGRVKNFFGNFAVLVRAYAYLRTMGPDGLRTMSEAAVLNANYVAARLKNDFEPASDRIPMHECVLSGKKQKQLGFSTLDIAKRLLDFGFHPPTIYFPLIVPEAIMIEPTETESKETLDAFVEAIQTILREGEENPETLKNAPYHTKVRRLDEATAARTPILRWKK